MRGLASPPRQGLSILWVLFVRLLSLRFAHGIDTEHTAGIFGAIDFTDKPTTATRLLEQCYAGFTLNGCEDWNATSSAVTKSYAFASQFTDLLKRNQPYCLQCCTKPTPRSTGADETWNLSCPLNDLQRLSVSKGKRAFRFARRATLDDATIVECAMPNRTQATYLHGYTLTLWVIERSLDFGTKFWTSVENCSVAIAETVMPPVSFNEVIRLRSIPTPPPRPTAWIAPFVLSLVAIFVVLSVPIYKAGYLGQRCLHCGSWLVVVNNMCVVCICISCRLHPPPAKVYVDNGDPYYVPTVDEDDGDDESESSDSNSDSDARGEDAEKR